MQHKDPRYMQEIVEFVEDYFSIHHRSPTCRTIAEHTTLKRSAVYNYLVAMTEQGILRYDGKSITTPKIESLFPETNPVGIVGSIACGPLSLAEQEISEYINLPERLTGKGEFYLLRASGDSMIDAGIDDGDLVLIRKQETARDGEIIVAYVEGEGNTLKRLKKGKDCVILQPENSKYKDIIVKDCKIQGVAVWTLRQL